MICQIKQSKLYQVEKSFIKFAFGDWGTLQYLAWTKNCDLPECIISSCGIAFWDSLID